MDGWVIACRLSHGAGVEITYFRQLRTSV